MENYFTTNNLFYNSQYGFRKNHSTELAAVELVNRVWSMADKGDVPITIFLDLSKAFDTLNHSILLDKMSHYGIKNISLKLIASYLNNRKQFVNIDNVNSDYSNTITGVPQGSIWVPFSS